MYFSMNIPTIWGYIEPLVGVATLVVATSTWVKTRRAKRRVFKSATGKVAVVALQVGRPVSEAVKAAFGQLDALIDASIVIGGDGTLRSTDDYKRLASAVYKELAVRQNCKLKLVLSGPVALNCLIGQLIGLGHFDIEVFQFNPLIKGYESVPQPDRSWLVGK